ncbi:putative xin actin-binding repeat-containing protein 2-like [Scophthalmus maximus]|uniref:Putative xin actin-binding repeat-containing protein 2-like n=1 Tax=Scophthalmus maximus TaxID=52904 RepID=A0A2U9AVD5_SCOMX|nr:putative xin actin-binding repeat-containing protein 2-like [Scophthalmus maximus]
METQSGNGEEVASAASATSGSVSRRPSGPQVDEPALREDLQAAKRIERFHIPLDSLKRMFEKPAAASAVSTATVEWILPFSRLCCPSCDFPLLSSVIHSVAIRGVFPSLLASPRGKNLRLLVK